LILYQFRAKNNISSEGFRTILLCYKYPSTTFRLRFDEQVTAKAEKTSVLLGCKKLTADSVLNENSTKVSAQHKFMTVENDNFDKFMETCNKASTPNSALTSAAQFSREQKFKSAIQDFFNE